MEGYPQGTGEEPSRQSAVGSSGAGSRRRFLQAAGGAGTLAFAGCLEESATVGGLVGSAEAAEGPVTVGVLAPNPSGDFIGRSMARGAEIAVRELNDRGGIGGRDVELAVGDTAANPLEARREYHRLVLEEGADVTVGIFDSPSLVHVMDDVAEQEQLHLTTGAATSIASQRVHHEYETYKYHFRVGPTNEIDLGRGIVDFVDGIAPEVGWESVAVLVEDYDWTQGPWSVLQDDLAETGIDVVLEERYPPATDDFGDLYDRVADQGADVALVAMAHTGTEAILDWTAPAGRGPYPFEFGGIHVPMQLPTYYEQTRGACRFAFGQVSATATSDVGPLTQDFVSAYEARFGDTPVYTGYTTYEAVLLYDHVVESTGSFDEDDLIPALEDVSFEGATGTIEFYDRDHQFAHDLQYYGTDALFYQWQENDDGEGVQEVIWPEEHATSEYVSPPWL